MRTRRSDREHTTNAPATPQNRHWIPSSGPGPVSLPAAVPPSTPQAKGVAVSVVFIASGSHGSVVVMAAGFSDSSSSHHS